MHLVGGFLFIDFFLLILRRLPPGFCLSMGRFDGSAWLGAESMLVNSELNGMKGFMGGIEQKTGPKRQGDNLQVETGRQATRAKYGLPVRKSLSTGTMIDAGTTRTMSTMTRRANFHKDDLPRRKRGPLQGQRVPLFQGGKSMSHSHMAIRCKTKHVSTKRRSGLDLNGRPSQSSLSSKSSYHSVHLS